MRRALSSKCASYSTAMSFTVRDLHGRHVTQGDILLDLKLLLGYNYHPNLCSNKQKAAFRDISTFHAIQRWETKQLPLAFSPALPLMFFRIWSPMAYIGCIYYHGLGF